jgi:hypothetical protein
MVENDEEKKMKVLHGTWSCSLKQINKGTIKAWGEVKNT